MTGSQLKRTSDFEKLRSIGGIYVDKTDLIRSLVMEGGPILLVRPRRFGKSHFLYPPWYGRKILTLKDEISGNFLELRF